MKSPPSLCALALAAAVGLPGCGESNGARVNPVNDGGSGNPDLGASPGADLAFFTGSDLGAASDGAAGAWLTMVMRTPVPLASALPTSQELDFDVVLNDASQNDVENWLTIAPRKSAAPPITAGFLWKAAAAGGFGAYSLHVIPTAPLDDLIDYNVHVIDQHVFRTVLATGFSTGSRPRLSSATLNAQNGGAMVWIDLAFSEAMNASTIGPALTVSSGGAPIAGTTGSSSAASYRFTFAGGSTGVSGPITVDLATAASAQTGVPLIAADWDSPTATGGDAGAPHFEMAFPNLPLTANTSFTWTPLVN